MENLLYFKKIIIIFLMFFLIKTQILFFHIENMIRKSILKKN